MNRGLAKSYEASAAIAPYVIAAFSDPANGRKVATAAGPAAPLVGTTGQVGARTPGVMVDVERSDMPLVRLGGPVGAGDQLTAAGDGTGRAVKVSAAGQRVIGQADEPGVADDIITYMAAPSTAGGV